MIAALIIVFREVIEAGIVVGIVLAVTRGVPSRGLWIGYGVSGGVAGACLVAVFAGAIANAFAGSGQELFNAVILLVAVRSSTPTVASLATVNCGKITIRCAGGPLEWVASVKIPAAQ